KPQKAILTHFGRTALALKPWETAAEMSQRLGIEVIAASDGLKIEIP
ncbi:MAG: MBL fold metallo-hydrolase, partial [bacterium (Candidatus Ratteibacteria) CG23_combo_of_CG06-09_8_20_14_all_48_7]